MRLTLATPPGFSFERTVTSHGWCRLRPFHLDDDCKLLRGIVRRGEGGAVAFSLSTSGETVVVKSPGRGDAATRRLLRDTARRVLNLDLDLSSFREAARRVEGMEWMAGIDAGRLLRSPTAFEDLVKLVLTTNCTWAFTTRMVESLVERYGEVAADGSRSFPGPAAIARAGAVEIRRRCRAGYRAPAVVNLARDTAAGLLDAEAWERDEREPMEIRREMLGLSGVGPYVAENMLRFMGRPAGLGLDSWLRAKYARVYHGGRRVSDRTIGRRYARFGSWSGMALWCDMTRDWFVDGEPSTACAALE